MVLNYRSLTPFHDGEEGSGDLAADCSWWLHDEHALHWQRSPLPMGDDVVGLGGIEGVFFIGERGGAEALLFTKTCD